MRGPGIMPASIAFISETSAKPGAPTSRTVVKPASSVRRALRAPRKAASAGSSRTGRVTQSPSMSYVRCVCASIRPGRTVTSPRSMACAPAGASPPTLGDLPALDHDHGRRADLAGGDVEPARGADDDGRCRLRRGCREECGDEQKCEERGDANHVDEYGNRCPFALRAAAGGPWPAYGRALRRDSLRPTDLRRPGPRTG